ncbi:MAG: hypothetical protein HZB85_05355 [Deltaproteobacteria bacterium]|nr:hypothetical protein [Deltaproteobacteria bacterium]
MTNLLKVVVFSLGVIGAYTLFATTFTPAIKPEPPVTDNIPASTGMTLARFAALGERLYNGKGSCGLCHNPVGGRAPLLDDVALRAAGRIKEAGYKGSAIDATGYIYESMTTPSAYVVAGYGVVGSNDGQSPMPDVSREPIGLSAMEIRAVIAYLQQRAGAAITVGPDWTAKETR